MNDWRIRKAQLGDADAMASCIDAAYARYADRIADLPPVSAGCAVDIAKKWVWVAVSGDGTGDEIIAGFFLAPGDGFMTLANVAVHPDHAGKGVARALMARAESEAKKQGFGEMRLNTHVDMPENVRLYSRLGWREVSRDGNRVSMHKLL